MKNIIIKNGLITIDQALTIMQFFLKIGVLFLVLALCLTFIPSLKGQIPFLKQLTPFIYLIGIVPLLFYLLYYSLQKPSSFKTSKKEFIFKGRYSLNYNDSPGMMIFKRTETRENRSYSYQELYLLISKKEALKIGNGYYKDKLPIDWVGVILYSARQLKDTQRAAQKLSQFTGLDLIEPHSMEYESYQHIPRVFRFSNTSKGLVQTTKDTSSSSESTPDFKELMAQLSEEEIKSLTQKNNKIESIKMIRNKFQLPLRKAKEFLEHIEKELK